jgi:hypothetical protein
MQSTGVQTPVPPKKTNTKNLMAYKEEYIR